MNRVIQPELLDLLPHGHPDALGSRRDLVLINRLMRNWNWLARELLSRTTGTDTIVEIGAGDGALGLWLHRRWAEADPPRRLHGLDLVERPACWPAAWGWTCSDVLAAPACLDADVIVANLVLHHFAPRQLRLLGSRLGRRVRLILACEPARGSVHLWQARALAFLGVNRVTRHDAPASVRAGFSGTELLDLLGLARPEWEGATHCTWLGAYRMVAARRTAAETAAA